MKFRFRFAEQNENETSQYLLCFYGKIGEMFRADVKTRIEDELSRGEAARREGFEGRARVNARRAAGAAIRAFYEQRGLEAPGPSAIDLLTHLQALIERGEIELKGNTPNTGLDARQVIEHLLLRVDESFSLSVEADLLAEARWLASTLEENL